MMPPMRIESHEIPLFMTGCVVDATRWEVEGTRYDQWRAEHAGGKDTASQWRDEIVIPYLQR